MSPFLSTSSMVFFETIVFSVLFEVSMASRGTFLKISFLALAFATSSVLGECPPNEYVPGNGCSPTPNVCEITCPKDEACGLSEGCATVGVTEDMVKDGNMTKEICPVLCQASNSTTSANPCRFWRWVSFFSFNLYCISNESYIRI